MPLPLHITPAERETLCSVMSRMATVNGLNVAEFCTDVGTSLAAILEGKPEAIAVCADITGAIPDKLSRWSPRRHERGTYHFNAHLLPSKTLRDPEIRGCPYCLRADAAMGTGSPHRHMALRGHWLVKHVTFCLIHDHPLFHSGAGKSRVNAMTQQRGSARLRPPFLQAILIGLAVRLRNSTNGWTQGWKREPTKAGSGSSKCTPQQPFAGCSGMRFCVMRTSRRRMSTWRKKHGRFARWATK